MRVWSSRCSSKSFKNQTIEVSEVVLSGLSLGPMGRFQSEAGKEGQSSPSPGQRPGLYGTSETAPCKGKTVALKSLKDAALTGRCLVATLLPRVLPWARRYCPCGAFVCPLVLTRLPRRPVALHAPSALYTRRTSPYTSRRLLTRRPRRPYSVE